MNKLGQIASEAELQYMQVYPKIQTLFNRRTEGKKKGKVIEGEIRWPEFCIPPTWYATEKIHGRNMRVALVPSYMDANFPPGSVDFDKMVLRFAGRKNGVQHFEPGLLEYLQHTFLPEKMKDVFPTAFTGHSRVILYMEAYGPKIQKGRKYRDDISVRLFDVWVQDTDHPLGGWWLEPDNIRDIAQKLRIKWVPVLGYHMEIETLVKWIKGALTGHPIYSEVSIEENPRAMDETPVAEGIVCRTTPMLFTRKGERLMWKLKVSDFERK